MFRAIIWWAIRDRIKALIDAEAAYNQNEFMKGWNVDGELRREILDVRHEMCQKADRPTRDEFECRLQEEIRIRRRIRKLEDWQEAVKRETDKVDNSAAA